VTSLSTDTAGKVGPELRLVDPRTGERPPPTADEIRARLDSGTFFWLDLARPGAAEFALLRELFDFHPLALEDSEQFGQRPKLDDYDDFLFLVAYGAVPDEDDLVEVHFFVSSRCLVTVRRDELPSRVDRICNGRGLAADREPGLLLHEIIDALVDSFFVPLATIDEQMSVLDGERLTTGEPGVEGEIFAFRRRLTALRRVVSPQRDVVQRIASGITDLPGTSVETERRFRDVFDHLVLIDEMIASNRELLSGATEVHLAAVSNRLNVVMKQLTVIATVFMPLTFLTGFFGQNFGWMVDHVDSAAAFIALGLVFQSAVVVGLVAFFRRRGWL
jgi:magnesium transporter